MRLLEKALSMVAPHDCVVCGQEGSVLCNWCSLDACPALPSQCYRCHRLSPDSRVCVHCRSMTRLRYVWLRTEYDDIAKRLIHELKFGRNQAVALVIAELLQAVVPYLPPNTLIVHVPTSTTHVRQRGYDQAKLIAAALAQRLGRPHDMLLARTGQRQQVGSQRRERLTQLSGAFRPIKSQLINKAYILLVDDVLTTGATLEEAARTLRQAGATRVDAAVFARTQ